ncbi:MAG: TIGR00341 family protein, partial [Fimbriimonadaceae bacterium]|nr:TIGR00341 family protein [Fimbriimonadaceae bacterium]
MDEPGRKPRLPIWRREKFGHDLTPKLPEELREIHRRVRSDLGDGARLSWGFFIINSLATVVACYGLLANSTAVVIGAMLIATLLGPIAGIALGLVDGNSPLLRTALLSEGLGVLAVVGLATIVGGIHHDIPATAEMLSRTKPNLLDLVIALAGGAAMAYALVSTNLSAGVVGVAIATALVPPLSSCGLLLARGEWQLAGGAFLLFFTNLVAIESAVSLVLWLYGFRRAVRDVTDAQVFVRTKVFSIGLLLLLGIFLYVNLSQAIDKNQ